MDKNKSLVLVVDDIVSNIEFITDILSTLEHIEVYGTHNGPSTLEFVS